MSSADILSYIDEIVTFKPGATIFREGELGNFMYLILEGEVEVWRGGARLAVRRSGEIIGEIAFFDGGGRSAMVFARNDCRMARITRERFEFLVQNFPDFAALVLARLNQ